MEEYKRICSGAKLVEAELEVETLQTVPLKKEVVEDATLSPARSMTQTTVPDSSVTFQWPSNGYVGFIYNRPIGGEKYHNGIDIWTNKNGTGVNGGVKGNPVYPVYAGQVDAIYSNDLVPNGVRINHGIIDGQNIWTHYWHLGREETRDSNNDPIDIGESYIVTSNGQQVDMNSLVGYQGNACYKYYDPNMETHVHITVSNTNVNATGHIDPSPFYGIELNWDNEGHLNQWMYPVSTGAVAPPNACAPTVGEWLVTTSCTYTDTVSAPSNVIVKNNSTLTIDSTASLDVDFVGHKLVIENGSSVRILSGGKIH